MVAKLSSVTILIILLLVGAGCEKVFESDTTIIIETDRLLYSVGDTMTVRIVNPGQESVYVRRCGPQSYRFALIAINEQTGTEEVLVPDVCRSFNQLRIGIRPGSETELVIPLGLDLPRGMPRDGLYQLEIYLVGTLPGEPDPSIPNRTNTFVLTVE